jgi:hypothetical protein
MEDYSEAREFLESHLEAGKTLATLIQAERDEIVITAVSSEGDEPRRPLTKRVLVADKNETLKGVLLKGLDGKFSDFPADFPCLRFDPPFIDQDWPDRPEPIDDDLDHPCNY